ncbi:MAG TPA: type I methionyl aminopeptidase [Bacteroidetes bacterium]|nr:type I methionyl aminopeptidase [Bacteroidota bacterium]
MASGKIILKSERDVAMLRRAARLVEQVLADAASRIAPGVTTISLDTAAESIIRDAGARPSFKGYQFDPDEIPFPGSLCISVNDVVVHGIPREDVVLQEGDVVSVDCGVELDGYFGDFAYTFPVGEISEENRALLEATKQSLYEGIDKARAGNRVGDIGHAVQEYTESRGYGVVTALVGHGIGQQMHEPPSVPNVGRRGWGKKLKSGMTVCIEPMINRGTPEVTVDPDGWTIRTADGLPSAHYEHMVHVTKGGAELISSYDAIEAALAAARGESAPKAPPAASASPTATTA